MSIQNVCLACAHLKTGPTHHLCRAIGCRLPSQGLFMQQFSPMEEVYSLGLYKGLSPRNSRTWMKTLTQWALVLVFKSKQWDDVRERSCGWQKETEQEVTGGGRKGESGGKEEAWRKGSRREARGPHAGISALSKASEELRLQVSQRGRTKNFLPPAHPALNATSSRSERMCPLSACYGTSVLEAHRHLPPCPCPSSLRSFQTC